MPPIKTDFFRGTIPKIDGTLLPENNAQTAENVYVDTGKLRGLKIPAQETLGGAGGSVAKTGAIRAIYKQAGDWLAWNEILTVEELHTESGGNAASDPDLVEGEGNASTGFSSPSAGFVSSYAPIKDVGSYSIQHIGAPSKQNILQYTVSPTEPGERYRITFSYYLVDPGDQSDSWSFKVDFTQEDVDLTPTFDTWVDVSVDVQVGNAETILNFTSFSSSTAGIRYMYVDNLSVRRIDRSALHIVESQIPDSDDRIAYSGDTYPKQTNHTLATAGVESTWPTTNYRLGVIAPEVAPTVALTGTPSGTIERSSSYVYTRVTGWGEESAPSPPSAVVDVEGTSTSGESVDVSVFAFPAYVGGTTYSAGQRVVDAAVEYRSLLDSNTGNTPATSSLYWELVNNNMDIFRIYRTAVGTTGAEFQFVKEIPYATSTTNDALDDVDLGEVLPTVNWDAPPSGLRGLTQVSNGILAGYVGNTVHFSEPFVPYAFPSDYSVTIEHDIVSIEPHQDSLVILTTSIPYIVTGVDPANMSFSKLPYEQACVNSKGSISTPTGVFYPCPDGLFFVSQVEGRLITQDVYTKEQWQDLFLLTVPSLGSPEVPLGRDIISFFHDNKFVGLFDNTNEGIIFDFGTNTFTSVELHPDHLVVGGYIDPVDDSLYILTHTADYSAYYVYNLFGGTLSQPYIWRSKEFAHPLRGSYAAARIIADYSSASSSLTGTLRFFSSGRVDGVGTAFLTEVNPGDYVKNDTDDTWVKVATIESDIDITLDESYAPGTTSSGLSGDVTQAVGFKLFVDDVQQNFGAEPTKAILSDTPIRLPATRGRNVSFQVESNELEIEQVIIADSVMDI